MRNCRSEGRDLPFRVSFNLQPASRRTLDRNKPASLTSPASLPRVGRQAKHPGGRPDKPGKPLQMQISSVCATVLLDGVFPQIDWAEVTERRSFISLKLLLAKLSPLARRPRRRVFCRKHAFLSPTFQF